MYLEHTVQGGLTKKRADVTSVLIQRDSSFHTATGSWAGQLSDSGFGSRLTPEVLLISTRSRRVLRPTQPSSQWITGGKAAGA